MSVPQNPNPIETDSTPSDSYPSKKVIFRALGALLQLLAISLCVESLLGLPDGLGILLRFALIAAIMFCITLRWGWLSLIALQVSLVDQEPRRQPLEQTPSAFLYVLLACFVIVIAMKLPQVHGFVTDCFIRLIKASATNGESMRASIKSSSKQIRTVLGFGFAFRISQMVMSVVLGIFLLTHIPIGQQSNSWLQWSRDHGQAVWPGSLLLVLMIAVFVFARENAWRQIASSQAKLYLRSQQLITNGQDFFSFERRRQKQKGIKRLSEQTVRKPSSRFAKTPKSPLTNTETDSTTKDLQ